MRRNQQMKHSESQVPQLEVVTRLVNIPIVETGWSYAGQMYSRLKNSNSLVHWTLGTAESSFNTVLDVALPSTVAVFGGPIHVIDKFLCKSLDIVEQRVPSIYLPPQMMYWQTKQYVSSTFVRPVLKRADSVKQLGNTVLASKYTAFAAERLEGALTVADKYVDKYLPDAADQALDEADSAKAPVVEGPAGKAVQTMQHVDRFSRKLQRRLTKRTLAEAKALKDRSAESMHVLLYVAELVATDPKLALEKARELWESLSKDEPENQARPATLEQLIVMLTRESARRLVHLVNFTRSAVTKLPGTISWGVNATTQQCLQLADSLVKTIHLDEVTTAAASGAKVRAVRMTVVLQELNTFANAILEHLALALAGQKSPKQSVKSTQQRFNHHQQPHPQATLHPPVVRNQFRAAHRYTNSVLNNGAQS